METIKRMEQKNTVMSQMKIDYKLLDRVFEIIKHNKELDQSIQSILEEIGTFYGLSRITVCEYDFINGNPIVSHQWLREGFQPYFLNQNKKSELDFFESWNFDSDLYCFEDVTKIDPIDRLCYERLGIQAMVQCGFYENNQMVGMIHFDDCIQIRKWEKEVLDTLTILTKFIGEIIIHIRNKKMLQREIFYSQAVFNNQRLVYYSIKEDTYELVNYSAFIKNLFPNLKIGEVCYKALFDKDSPCETCPIRGLSKNNGRSSYEFYDSNNEAWFSITATSMNDMDGQKIYILGISDVTGFLERVNAKDALTGLLTLSRFEADASRLITKNSDKNYAFLYIDFDKFKNINDEWGYSRGNEILYHYAKISVKHLNSSELACRVSEDKFIKLLTYEDRNQLINRVIDVYGKIREHFTVNFPDVNPIITCGIYFLMPEDKVISMAVDKANLARKSIKGSHKSDIAIYDESFHRRVSKEIMIETHMHEALKNNDFLVYMQPKIDLKTQRIIGAEALVRWKLPDGKILGPMEFIPIFEQNGFIDKLDFYVYEKTFQVLRDILDTGKKALVVSINVSRNHLNDSHFIDRLNQLVKKYNIPNELIELEITESMFFKELDRLIYMIKKLREYGFLISIDDFGSGYSSLNLLKDLPVDILKIDKEFFMERKMNNEDKIVISGIISLAKGLGLKVLSEGVETKEQAEFLAENSCDMAQGYWFYRPMPIEEFVEILNES